MRWHYGRTGDTGGIPWAHGFGPPAAVRVNEVVGAGPAGLAAAITFAKAERPVRVLERHRFVGQRFHGDMQGLENWSMPEDALDRIRGMGIDADFDYRPFDAVTFYDSQLRAAVVRTPRPLFYLLRRGPTSGTLDTALLRQARAVGAEVRLGETAHTAAPGTILATGPGSADGLVAGFTFSTTLADQAHAIVHPTLAPAGYAYLLIWDGRGTVATSLFSEMHRWRSARTATVETFQRLVPDLRLDEARPFGGYGAVFAATRFTDRPGRSYVGEAAGLQDAEWGFGIMTALRSGALAASSALEGGDFDLSARREFDPRRAAGFANRAVFEALPMRLLDTVLHRETGTSDLTARMGRHWAPNTAKSLLGPLKAERLRQRTHRPGAACDDSACLCVRCTCGRADTDCMSVGSPESAASW